METVIRHFLDKSKAKLDEALAKVDEVAGPETGSTTMSTQMTKEDGTIQTVEVEDLDEAETPESILLSTVSDEKSRDRTYRTLVTPWLRFLWESYRTALDTLRNNTRLEVLYQVRTSSCLHGFGAMLNLTMTCLSVLTASRTGRIPILLDSRQKDRVPKTLRDSPTALRLYSKVLVSDLCHQHQRPRDSTAIPRYPFRTAQYSSRARAMARSVPIR